MMTRVYWYMHGAIQSSCPEHIVFLKMRALLGMTLQRKGLMLVIHRVLGTTYMPRTHCVFVFLEIHALLGMTL